MFSDRGLPLSVPCPMCAKICPLKYGKTMLGLIAHYMWECEIHGKFHFDWRAPNMLCNLHDDCRNNLEMAQLCLESQTWRWKFIELYFEDI